MNIPLDAIKELRNLTSASVAECKKALGEANGNVHEAMALLRKRGLEISCEKRRTQCQRRQDRGVCPPRQ